MCPTRYAQLNAGAWARWLEDRAAAEPEFAAAQSLRDPEFAADPKLHGTATLHEFWRAHTQPAPPPAGQQAEQMLAGLAAAGEGPGTDRRDLHLAITLFCNNFRRGACKHGDACTFAHAEVRASLPSVRTVAARCGGEVLTRLRARGGRDRHGPR